MLDNPERKCQPLLNRTPNQRRADAVLDWEGILPPIYAVEQVEWERYKMAKTMLATGFSKADIARALGGISVNRVNVILQYGQSGADLFRTHIRNGGVYTGPLERISRRK